MNFLNIPQHKNCKNCGGCCGPVPINKAEKAIIEKYVQKHKPLYNKHNNILECKFRMNGKCTIYTVRPVLCRIFGVVEGLDCPNGNSANLNASLFVQKEKEIGLLNNVIKTNY
ncbi:hypothetical protein BFS06_11660 [Clostridium perfringens]|uniref:YkgJ family cysteine cluster protein n=1 Tax=Clostridium perfringens TaxID=1502 RepID=UPI0010400E60|nr:YkgJ family cysteine cluster protein [Clostridium perfringens]TBX14869.1 hypothetical protein BFS06_11660 [Clostridium perfringens]